jgi:hypothetical protein
MGWMFGSYWYDPTYGVTTSLDTTDSHLPLGPLLGPAGAVSLGVDLAADVQEEIDAAAALEADRDPTKAKPDSDFFSEITGVVTVFVMFNVPGILEMAGDSFAPGDIHDHHLLAREFGKIISAIAAAEGEIVNIDDFAALVEKQAVHYSADAELAAKLKDAGLRLSNGGRWNSELKLFLNSEKLKNSKTKTKLIIEYMLEQASRYDIDLTTLSKFGLVKNAKNNAEAMVKLIELADRLGVDKKYRNVFEAMAKKLATTKEGLAALETLSKTALKKSGKIVGWVLKIGGAVAAPIVVVWVSKEAYGAEGGGIGAAAEAAIREITIADDLAEGAFQLVVIDGGEVVCNELCDVRAFIERRYGKNLTMEELDSYILVGIEDYMNRSGVSALRDYAAYLRSRYPNRISDGWSSMFEALFGGPSYRVR